MYDILELLHLDRKEDVYTFCLSEFLEKSEIFRKKSAKQWGFRENENRYYAYRGAIEFCNSDCRNKIIPDLVLYNSYHIAVIESKMFSSEGYNQTVDYYNARKQIIEKVQSELCKKNEVYEGGDNNISFYYFTLAGVPAESSEYEVVRWSDYYNLLDKVKFDDIGLEALCQAIFQRAKGYTEFMENYSEYKYFDILKNKNSWISPFSLLSGGLLNGKWGDCYVYNGMVNGKGHSTYRTDISDRKKGWITGKSENDNFYIFTRIEWNENNIILALNWEYWHVRDGVWVEYIPYAKLGELQAISYENKLRCWDFLDKVKDESMRIPSRKKTALHMIIKTVEIDNKRTFKEIIEEIRTDLLSIEKLKDSIFECIDKDEQYLMFKNPYS